MCVWKSTHVCVLHCCCYAEVCRYLCCCISEVSLVWQWSPDWCSDWKAILLSLQSIIVSDCLISVGGFAFALNRRLRTTCLAALASFSLSTEAEIITVQFTFKVYCHRILKINLFNNSGFKNIYLLTVAIWCALVKSLFHCFDPPSKAMIGSDVSATCKTSICQSEIRSVWIAQQNLRWECRSRGLEPGYIEPPCAKHYLWITARLHWVLFIGNQ